MISVEIIVLYFINRIANLRRIYPYRRKQYNVRVEKVLEHYNELVESAMYGKVCYTPSIIIDLTRLISFELGRVIDENACKELLNQITVKKVAQQAQRESNADCRTKLLCFLTLYFSSLIDHTVVRHDMSHS